MKSNYIKTIIFTILLIGLQVWVFTPIALWQVATPIICPVLLCLLPMNSKPLTLTLFGFIAGSIIDYLSFTPGLNASALSLTGFIRYYLIQIHTDAQDDLELLPLPKSVHGLAYFIIAELLLIHHLIIYLLSIGLYQDWIYFAKRFVTGYALSYIISILLLSTLTISIGSNKNDQ